MLITNDIKERNLKKIIKNRFFSILDDKIPDMRNNAIFPHAYRMVNDLLEVEEIFAALRVLKEKKAEILSNKGLVRASFHTLAHIIKYIIVTSFNS